MSMNSIAEMKNRLKQILLEKSVISGRVDILF